jgi:formiminoglutamase
MEIQLIEKTDVEQWLSRREGESKIGEKIYPGADYGHDLSACPAPFVLLTVEEDMGPRANHGRGGAGSACLPFLKKFVNLQHNRFLQGDQVLLWGNLKPEPAAPNMSVEKLREKLTVLDEQLAGLIEKIVAAKKTPIVIGGGHNNAYGLLKGSSKAMKHPLNCLNLDPHADFRELEGRHSGNGFSYAFKEKYLQQYAVIGLHRIYNSETLIERLEQAGVFHRWYDDWLSGTSSFKNDLEEALGVVNTAHFGVELDLDAIQNLPASAQTPSGITVETARRYLLRCGREKHACYLHLPEAAPDLMEGSEEQCGKLLAYLASDFIQAKCELWQH